MSAFKFRLQSVLELRQQEEQSVAAKLVVAETAADEARVAQQALETIRESGSHALRAAHSSEATIGQLKTIGFVIEQMNQHIVQAQAKVEAAEQVVDQARTDLTSALQARRVLSRLRDRHYDVWRAEDSAKDLRLMDELALARFTRRDDTNNDSGAPRA
jgi:flagellar FliJ protein